MSKNTTPQFDKMIKDVIEFNTNCSQACTKSGAIFMKGMEDVMGTMMSLAQEASEKQAGFVKEVMNIKDISELSEIQNRIIKSSFEDFISGATKISEVSVKVLTQSAAPVSEQISKAMQKTTQSMAA